MPKDKELMKKALLEIRQLKAQLKEAKGNEPAAIIGMACRFPGGVRNTNDYWNLLKDGKSGICAIPDNRWNEYGKEKFEDNPYLNKGGFLEDIEEFDNRLFKILPDEAAYLDPQQRILLEVCWEAFENAGYSPEILKNKRVGVFVGVVQNDFGYENMLRNEENMNITGMDHSFISGRISYFFGLRGPSISIDTACSSSSVAIDTALKYLKDNDCDMALVCGVNIMFSPEITQKVAGLGILSKRGEVRAFDKDADGTVRGEGAAAIILKKLSDAKQDDDNIHSIIIGSELNQDGESTGLTAPNGIAQEELLRWAWDKAGIDSNDIGYIETHGTGTAIGDPIEIQAISSQLSVSRKKPVYIGSVKTNIGHLEGAAGIAGVIKVSLMLENKKLPKSLNYDTPSEYVNWSAIPVKVADKLMDWKTENGKPRIAGVSSFGLSGTNSHIVLKEYEDNKQAGKAMETYPFVLTSVDKKGLERQAEALKAYLETNDDCNLTDLSYSYNITRDSLPERGLIIGESKDELISKLSKRISSNRVNKKRRAVYVFTGQGSQYKGMCEQYYKENETFRRSFDHCADLFKKYIDRDLRDIVFSDDYDLNQTENAQPAIFAVEYSLVQMLKAYGIKPEVVIGHSIGEYAAACTAGVFSVEDAAKLVAARGQFMQELSPEGKMLAVFADRAKVQNVVFEIPGLYISTSNSPMQTVVAGATDAVEKADVIFKKKGIRTVFLKTERPFHTPFMDAAAKEFGEVAKTIDYSRPTVKMISTVTAGYESDLFADASYWMEQILSEVKYCDSINTVGNLEEIVFVEIGALPVLNGLISAITGGEADCVCMADKNIDMSHVIKTVCELYHYGIKVDFKKLYKPYSPVLKDIPNYAFAPNRIPYIHTLRGERECNGTSLDLKLQVENDSENDIEVDEKNVKTILSELLGTEPEELDEKAELVSLGIDSISAVSVLKALNKTFGTNLTLSRLFNAHTPGGVIEAVLQNSKNNSKKGEEGPVVVTINEEDRNKEFPLNEVQYAYWAGRDNNRAMLSGSACCAYFEADVDNLDEAKFIEALKKLEARHDMLRCRITEDAIQYIEKECTSSVVVLDISEENISELEQIREEMSHKILPLGGPLYEIRLSRLSGGRYRIHFLIDFMIADAMSLFIFKRDLNKLYRGEELENLTITYRDYELFYRRSKEIQQKQIEDEAFWTKKAQDFPNAPQLPYNRSVFMDNSNRRFIRRRMDITKDRWKSFSKNAARFGLTPSAALFALYSEVLSAYGGGENYAVMLTVFRRHDVGKDTENMIGDFTKLALVDITRKQTTIAENALALQQNMMENISHCEYSAVKFTDMLRKQTGESRLYPVIFTSAVGLDETLQEESGIMDSLRSVVSSTPQVCLDHQVFFENGTIVLSWDSLDEAFCEGVVDAMFEVYCDLVNKAIDGKEFFSTTLTDLRSTKQKEEQDKANGTNHDYMGKLLHEGFIENVKRIPDKAALINDGCTYTYAQLNERANSIANAVIEAGATPGDRVLIELPKSFEQIAAVLGVLKAGCIYVPLTYGQPKVRTERVIEKAKPVCIITDRAYEITNLKKLVPNEIAGNCNKDINREVKASDGAYIIYTSGSTGQPKGVFITHEAAMNTIEDVNRKYRICESDSAIAVSSLSFDLSVYDIFGMLTAGGTIVMPTEEQRIDPKQQYELVVANNVTLWNSVPTIMDIFADHLLKRGLTCNIRKVILSGDWIPMELPDKLYKALPNGKLTSMGGATEASIWSNYFDVNEPLVGWTSVPYGYPLANQRFYILDEFGRRCPDHIPGKLHIAGSGLAKGYYNEPELTKAAFINHELTGEHLYDTGDYGCYHKDGCIEFLGRKDGQVKINGYRVETAEIEAAVKKCGINDRVAAVPVGNKTKRLAVFIETENEPDSSKIIEQLKTYLPHYFIPEAIVNISSFPLTANGKFDRKKLADIYENLELKKVKNHRNTGNDSPVLKKICEILDIADVDPGESFGHLGVSSVDMIRLADELENAYGIRPSVSKMLSYNAISELVEFFDGKVQQNDNLNHAESVMQKVIRIEDSLNEISPLEKYEEKGITLYIENGALRFKAEKGAMTDEIRQELKQDKQMILDYLKEKEKRDKHKEEYIKKNAYPLTPIQKAYLLGRSNDYELGGTSAHYYAEFIWDKVDAVKLENAVNTLIDSHDILRSIVLEDGRQMTLEKVPIYRVADRKLSDGDFKALRDDWKDKIYEVGKWPMFDVFVSRLQDGSSVVHFSFDCMLLDGWSANMMIRQIYELYKGKSIDVPNYSFCRYVCKKDEWQKDKDYVISAENYWKQRASKLSPAPKLPYNLQFNQVKQPHFDRLRYELSREQTQKLNIHLRNYSSTASAVVCTAYMRALSMAAGSEKFSLNLTVYNRLPLNQEVKKLLGDFTNVTVVEYQRDKEGCFLEEMKQVKARILEAVEHRTYNGLEILKEMSDGDPFKAVLPVVFTSELFGSLDEEDTSDIFKETKELFAISQTPQVSLDHQALVREGKLVLIWDYVKELFKAEVISEMFNKYISFIEELADADSWEKM